MSMKQAQEMLQFIERSPSCFHVVSNIEKELEADGFLRLYEKEKWVLEKGRKYYVVRNGSALIGFKLPQNGGGHFQIMTSHSDSPALKLKQNPGICLDEGYVKLNVEGYGGMLLSPWFDRPLSLAGRLLVKEGEQIATRLVNVDRDLLLIPSLAVHMDRKANEGHLLNIQKELQPLYTGDGQTGRLVEELASCAGVSSLDILGMDVFLYNRVAGSIWGGEKEFLSSRCLDDLECVYCTLQGFLQGTGGLHTSVFCVMDNEEVGSLTRQGAASTFLKDVLRRICNGTDNGEEEYHKKIAGSFMISTDNAHGLHPNYMEKADDVNRPYLNKGIVIKHSANQRYTTDGVSGAIFKMVCEKAQVPWQEFSNRSDVVGGSTLGNLSIGQVPIRTVDVGLAQLAMHSPYETAGVKDVEFLLQAAKTFYSMDIQISQDEKYGLK